MQQRLKWGVSSTDNLENEQNENKYSVEIEAVQKYWDLDMFSQLIHDWVRKLEYKALKESNISHRYQQALILCCRSKGNVICGWRILHIENCVGTFIEERDIYRMGYV